MLSLPTMESTSKNMSYQCLERAAEKGPHTGALCKVSKFSVLCFSSIPKLFLMMSP